MKNIKSKSDCELINKTILSDALTVIGLPFLGVVNSSLEEETYPENWKNSVVTPIPKIPGTSKGEEFRPINQLPTYEKILEGIVKKQINQHMSKNKIIIDDQFGFREGHDCEAALNILTVQWKLDIDNNKIVIAVFIDLKRAFETIDRERLLNKLETYGIKGGAKKWFESYLSNRTQYTKYGGASSSKIQTKYGVLQGSKLSSDLFLLYINDIISCLKYAKLVLFAIYTTIYLTCNDLKNGIEQINEDLERLNKWLNINKMKLNVDKSKCIIFNKKSDVINFEPMKINDETIETVDKIKTLGIIIPKNLKMKEHVEYTVKKIAKKIGFMGRTS